MKKLFLCTALALDGTLHAHVFPSPEWGKAAPEKYGYDTKKLETVRRHIIENMCTTGCMVVVSGETIFEYGSLTRISYIASCRKSVLSMMYGKWVENGTIDLSRTVGELGLDDVGGLLPVEKQATVGHLITSRSGVYHDASNPGDDAKSRPPRGSKEPGTYFLYNNWDFNAAGEVFERLTKKNIYEAFLEQIALPTGMQDYDLKNQEKGGDLAVSRFPAYHFYLSTRDMARIGYLMLRGGKWNDQQVISPEWMARMTSVVTPLNEMNPNARRNIFEYGYMWWLFKIDEPAFAGAYTARGAMGQFITVLPALDMVVAHKTDAVYGRSTLWSQYEALLRMIINARVATAGTATTDDTSKEVYMARVAEVGVSEKCPLIQVAYRTHDTKIMFETANFDFVTASPDATTVFQAASISKVLFSYIVMRLADRGVIDLDRPLYEYTGGVVEARFRDAHPDNADASARNEAWAKRLTARLALTHGTGLPNWMKDGGPSAAKLIFTHEPDTRYTYSGEGIHYLQRVVEHITGQKLNDLAEQEVFAPLGMTCSSYRWRDEYAATHAHGYDANNVRGSNQGANWAENAAYSLHTNVKDFSLFLDALMEGRGLKRETFEAMMSPLRAMGTGSTYFGLGIRVDPNDDDDCGPMWHHSGSNTNFRAMFWIFPKEQSYCVYFTNSANGADATRQRIFSIFYPP